MAPAVDWVTRQLRFAPAFAAGVAVLWADRLLVALLWFAASRIAYVGYVAATLVVRDRRALPPRDALPAWERFRDRVEWLMWNDAVAFSAVVLHSRGSLDASWPTCIAAGLALFALGVGVKTWAARHISKGAYYWRDFFLPPESPPVVGGPYRFLPHPMYTVGYAHVYGVALAFRSTPALLCGVFAQASMLLLEGAIEATYGDARETSAVQPVGEPAPPPS